MDWTFYDWNEWGVMAVILTLERHSEETFPSMVELAWLDIRHATAHVTGRMTTRLTDDHDDITLDAIRHALLLHMPYSIDRIESLL